MRSGSKASGCDGATVDRSRPVEAPYGAGLARISLSCSRNSCSSAVGAVPVSKRRGSSSSRQTRARREDAQRASGMVEIPHLGSRQRDSAGGGVAVRKRSGVRHSNEPERRNGASFVETASLRPPGGPATPKLGHYEP